MNKLTRIKNTPNIGFVIRKKRILKGLSQSELSKQTNITVTFLNLIENGRRNPSLNTLQSLASKLDESAIDLINEAKRDDGDPRLKLAYLLGKVIKSGSQENIKKLLSFAESLDLEKKHATL